MSLQETLELIRQLDRNTQLVDHRIQLVGELITHQRKTLALADQLIELLQEHTLTPPQLNLLHEYRDLRSQES